MLHSLKHTDTQRVSSRWALSSSRAMLRGTFSRQNCSLVIGPVAPSPQLKSDGPLRERVFGVDLRHNLVSLFWGHSARYVAMALIQWDCRCYHLLWHTVYYRVWLYNHQLSAWDRAQMQELFRLHHRLLYMPFPESMF